MSELTPETMAALAKKLLPLDEFDMERAELWHGMNLHLDAWKADRDEIRRLRLLRFGEQCCICREVTTEISFQFGYGSAFDGEYVCWDCAPQFDWYVDLLKVEAKL